MNGQYFIDVDRGLVVKKHVGQISVDDEIEILNTIVSDPKFRKGMNAVCDFTDANVSWELADLDKFRAFVRRMSNAWGKCRWAIIFPSGKDASTAKLFVTLNEAFEESVSARLFRSMDEALAWAQAKTASEEPDK